MRSLNYWRRILYLHPKLNSDFRVSKYFNFREKCCKFWILCDITINLEVKKRGYIFPNIVILDRHQVWQSHDPTSVRLFTFVNKRCHTPFFVFHLFCTNSAQLGSFGSTPLNSAQFCSLRSTFKKDSFASIAFTFFKKMQLYHLIILLLVILLPVICPVIWCFPIWLTSSLSYPMAIFSANEIRTFYKQ